jgi:hypothetical protein
VKLLGEVAVGRVRASRGGLWGERWYFSRKEDDQAPPPSLPKFLLPETEAEYVRRLAAIRAQIKEHQEALLAEAASLEDRATGLQSRQSSLAQQELNRREADKLSQQSADLRNQAQTEEPQKFWGRRNSTEGELRRAENEMVAHQGLIVKQTFKEGGDKFWDKTERRIVRWTSTGQHFLVVLNHPGVRGEVLGTRTVTNGGYVGSSATREVTDYATTTEFGPPTVKWTTDKTAQFTNEELQAIV